MTLRFMSLASGSSGNCYYVGTADYGVLVDAGIGLRTIRKALRQADIDFERILAVLVTHDHATTSRPSAASASAATSPSTPPNACTPASTAVDTSTSLSAPPGA